MKNPKLSKEQQAVLFDKQTEVPFSGALLYTKDAGSYACANCGHTLFTSDTKYDAGCGWPSFDDAVEGALHYSEDTSHGMIRTEITCAHCGGHIGHVFPDHSRATGRWYCANSLSLQFEPKKA